MKIKDDLALVNVTIQAFRAEVKRLVEEFKRLNESGKTKESLEVLNSYMELIGDLVELRKLHEKLRKSSVTNRG